MHSTTCLHGGWHAAFHTSIASKFCDEAFLFICWSLDFLPIFGFKAGLWVVLSLIANESVFILKFKHNYHILPLTFTCNSSGNFLSPILVSDLLIFCCRNSILHQKKKKKKKNLGEKQKNPRKVNVNIK